MCGTTDSALNAGQFGLGGNDTIVLSTPTLNPFLNGTTTLAVSLDWHVFALQPNGQVYVFGHNMDGQLGLGFKGDVYSVTLNPYLVNIVHASLGVEFSIALDSLGQIFSCGANTQGQLGLGMISEDVLFPQRAFNASDVIQVSAGKDHTLALTSTGQVYSWGGCGLGQCGRDFTDLHIPVLVPLTNKISRISAGSLFSTVVATNGVVFVFGTNLQGRIGFEDTMLSQMTPRSNGKYGFGEVSCGDGVTLLVSKINKKVMSYGLNDINALGYGLLPTMISGPEFSNIDVGRVHSLYISKEKTLYSSGQNSRGELGLGTIGNKKYTPNLIDSPGSVKQICTGGVSVDPFSVVLTESGNVYTFGDSHFLGHNDVVKTTPTKLEIPVKISAISCINRHILLLTDNGNVWAFGENAKQEITSNTPVFISKFAVPVDMNMTEMNITSIWTGGSTSWFKTNNSEFYVRGYNSENQLGLNATHAPEGITLTFHPFLTVLNVTDLAIGRYSGFALTKDLGIYCWGRNNYGQLGLNHTFPIPYPIPNPFIPFNVSMISISSGEQTMVIIGNLTDTNTTQVFVFGRNDESQLGLEDISNQLMPVNLPILNPVAVFAGEKTSMMQNECPSGWSGLNCDSPVCYGISAQLPTSCYGAGDCIAPDTCKCYNPSTGVRCQLNEYHWISGNGIWSDTGNWLIAKGGSLVKSISYPQFVEDLIFVDLEGTYTITVDVPVITVTRIEVGGQDVAATVIFENSQINTPFLNVTKQNSLVLKNTKLNVTDFFGYDGYMELDGNSQLIGSQDFQFSSNSFVFIKSAILNNINMTTLGKFQIDGSVTTTNVQLKTYGTSSVVSTNTIFFASSNWTNFGTALFRPVTTSSKNSFLINHGSITFDSSKSINHVSLDFINVGQLLVNGLTETIFASTFEQAPGARTELYYSKLTYLNPVTIRGGTFEVAGNLTCSNFTFASADGHLSTLETIIFTGNVDLTQDSTLILAVQRPTSDYKGNFIKVTKKLTISTFSILKLTNGYHPSLGDRIPFLEYGSVELLQSNVKLFGAPFKNCRYTFINGKGFFDVEFSFGSVASLGYKCHYLGNQKILESNYYGTQQKMVLTFTIPIKQDKFIGFGLDLNGNITNSWSTVVSLEKQIPNTILRNHLINQTTSPFLIIESTRSQSIFKVGPEYHTISILMPDNFLISQKRVFYAEFPNDRIPITHNYIENWDYSIKNSELNECTNFLQPGRNAGEHPASIGVLLGVFMILFLLCIVLRPFRPMNTRGISPGLTVFFLFIQMALEIRNHFEIPVFQGSLCVYLAYGVFPFQIVVYVMIFFYFLRYFSIINLNDNKRQIASNMSNRTQNTLNRIKIRIFRLFGSPIFALSMTFMIYILTNVIFTIPLSVTGFRCSFTTLFVLKVLANILLIFIYLATLLTFAVDLIHNYPLILRFQWIEYIFKRDPYYFRLQSLFFFVYMMYSLVTEAYSLFSTLDYFGVISNYPVTIAFNTVSNILMVLVIVLFPMIFTFGELIGKIIGRCRPKSRDDGLKHLFQDPECAQLFRTFAEREWSIENVMIYQDLQIYKAKMDQEFAKDLYLKYLNGADSILEVNITKSVCDEVKKSIDNGEMTETLFEKVEQNIVANLSDTYGRFLQTSAYRNLMKSKKQNIEMIEGKVTI